MAASSDNSYLVKGSIVRAHVAYLSRADLLGAVLSALDGAAAQQLRDPPLASSWVGGDVLADVADAVHRIGGDAAVLDMARGVVRDQAVQSLIPMVQGVLRLLGTSPASLLARFQDLIRTSARGLEFTYIATSERSGRMEVEHCTSRHLHRASFLTTVPAFELALRLCNARGRVALPELLGRNRARYDLAW